MLPAKNTVHPRLTIFENTKQYRSALAGELNIIHTLGTPTKTAHFSAASRMRAARAMRSSLGLSTSLSNAGEDEDRERAT